MPYIVGEIAILRKYRDKPVIAASNRLAAQVGARDNLPPGHTGGAAANTVGGQVMIGQAAAGRKRGSGDKRYRNSLATAPLTD